MRILIVEDEPLIADFITDSLGWAPAVDVVGAAGTAAEALRLAERHRPDLAVIDIGLGGDRDGWAVAASLRERFGTQALFITGLAHGDTAGRAARLGAAGCLQKPFRAGELVRLVERARPA